MVDAQWVQEMVNADDPLPIIWQAMFRIWATEALPDDMKAFYDEREERLHRLERFLSDTFSDLYDRLLEKATAQDGDYVRRWLQDDNVVIIADSLSVREAALLQHWLPGLDFLAEQPFAVVPFPTVTESLTMKLLGVGAPSSGRDTDKFAYRYIAGPSAADQQFPSDRPLLLWLRLPDAELEQVTEAQTTKVADVLERTGEVLGKLLQRLRGRKVIVTSDHGYFYGATANHFDELPSTLRKLPRERRAYKVSEVAQHLTPAQQSEYFVKVGDWLALKGRSWWHGSGQNARHTSHGGFSLAEVLVPNLTYP